MSEHEQEQTMTKLEADRRVAKAQSSVQASLRASEEACKRLEAAIEAAPADGVPVVPMCDDDSLAVSIDETRRDNQATITRTERSRRALRRATTNGG